MWLRYTELTELTVRIITRQNPSLYRTRHRRIHGKDFRFTVQIMVFRAAQRILRNKRHRLKYRCEEPAADHTGVDGTAPRSLYAVAAVLVPGRPFQAAS
jgi:hypothetical protein